VRCAFCANFSISFANRTIIGLEVRHVAQQVWLTTRARAVKKLKKCLLKHIARIGSVAKS